MLLIIASASLQILVRPRSVRATLLAHSPAQRFIAELHCALAVPPQLGRYQYDVSVERGRPGDASHSSEPAAAAAKKEKSVRVVVDLGKMAGIDLSELSDNSSDSDGDDMLGLPLAFSGALSSGKPSQGAPSERAVEAEEHDGEPELMGYVMIGNLQGTSPVSSCPISVGNAADIPQAIARASVRLPHGNATGPT